MCMWSQLCASYMHACQLTQAFLASVVWCVIVDMDIPLLYLSCADFCDNLRCAKLAFSYYVQVCLCVCCLDVNMSRYLLVGS